MMIDFLFYETKGGKFSSFAYIMFGILSIIEGLFTILTFGFFGVSLEIHFLNKIVRTGLKGDPYVSFYVNDSYSNVDQIIFGLALVADGLVHMTTWGNVDPILSFKASCRATLNMINKEYHKELAAKLERYADIVEEEDGRVTAARYMRHAADYLRNYKG